MNVNILPVYTSIEKHFNEWSDMPSGDFWEEYAIKPFWEKLCCYAPMDLSDRKPAPITDLQVLKKQVGMLHSIDLDALHSEFTKITESLPSFEDDTVTIALYPLGVSHKAINERQNGVVGTSLFGNIMIQINPFIEDYQEWIPYVFAHEYHHTVWGNYWYMMHGTEVKHDLLTALIIDGEADSFALSHYQKLKPQWLFALSDDDAWSLFHQQYAPYLSTCDFDYGKFMFGDVASNIPWCAGYAIGYRLVQEFLSAEHQSFPQLLTVNPAMMRKRGL
jgi:uncharacterized protein YjaZ